MRPYPLALPAGYATPQFLARYWAKVRKTEGCWQWLGSLTNGGYGHITTNHRPLRAHRVAYDLLVGPIPEGLVLDHLCRNRGCVNPAHLEPVTSAENCRRGIAGEVTRARLLGQTHCVRGHPLSGVNAAVSALGHRHCRACDRQDKRKYRRPPTRVMPLGPRRAIVGRISSEVVRLECGHMSAAVPRWRKTKAAICTDCESQVTEAQP